MHAIISKEAIAKSDFSMDGLLSWGASAGTLVGGMLTAHNALKLIKKQNSIIGTASALVAGIAGAAMLKNPWLKLLSLGVAGYGLLGTIILPFQDSPKTDATTSGLAGLIPDSIKEKIRGFLPTLGSIGDTLLGDDDLSGMPNLDDVAGVEDVGYVDVSEQQGIGSSML